MLQFYWAAQHEYASRDIDGNGFPDFSSSLTELAPTAYKHGVAKPYLPPDVFNATTPAKHWQDYYLVVLEPRSEYADLVPPAAVLPRRHGADGLASFLLDEHGKVYVKEGAVSLVSSFPDSPEAEGWQIHTDLAGPSARPDPDRQPVRAPRQRVRTK
jgi:hypothetical protein